MSDRKPTHSQHTPEFNKSHMGTHILVKKHHMTENMLHERNPVIWRCSFQGQTTPGCCWHKPWASSIQLFIYALTTSLQWQWPSDPSIQLQRDFKWLSGLNSACAHGGFKSAAHHRFPVDTCFHVQSLQKKRSRFRWDSDEKTNSRT